MNSNLKRLTTMAVLIAINIIFTRFISIQTPIVRVGFTFLPIAVSAMLYGPWWAGGGAAIADVIGLALFPTAGFFPGFTLTAFLTGVVYGVAFYNKEIGWKRIIIANAIICLILNLGLDTLWLYMMTGQGYIALLIPRIIKCAIMLPVQVALTYVATGKRMVSLLSNTK